MKRILLGTIAAAAVSVSAFTLTSAAQTDQQPSREERMQHWAADRETTLHSRLAGMRAGLGLRADQEGLWSPFESAVSDAFRSRTEATRKRIEARESGERMHPCERMESMAADMDQRAAELRKISTAARPLYDSLDDTQKRNFELLGRDTAMTESRSDPSGPDWYYERGGYSFEPPGWGWAPNND